MSHQDRREPLPHGYQFGDAHASHEAFARLSPQLALLTVRALRRQIATDDEDDLYCDGCSHDVRDCQCDM